MKQPEVARLMAELHFTEPVARAVLVTAGFPAHLLPTFSSAWNFWVAVVLLMRKGWESQA
jgi:hypothetical protein